MTEKCFDIGTMQAFLDGELDFGRADAVARHTAVCETCAAMLAVSEEESAFAFSALEQEFNTLVPTQRLWTKINDSIEREKKSFRKLIFAFLLQPLTVAFASLILVFAVVVSLLTMRPNQPIASYSPQNPSRIQPSASQPTIAQTMQNEQSSKDVHTPPIAPVEINPQMAAVKPNKTESRPVRAIYTKDEIVKDTDGSRNVNPPGNLEVVIPNRNENLSGEESYIKTIAALSETVNNRKDEVLNSSARFAFERDMQMTNDAIKNMREEIRKNPRNEAAKQILRASYQNKIDLLNSVAEKNELMAAVK